jgi:hypothetical protein
MQTSDYVPPNVKQQIELWEKELNCVHTKPAIMVLLNRPELAQRFGNFSLTKNITVYK